MDVGQTTKDVVLKIGAEGAPNVAPTFNAIGRQADDANRKVGSLSRSISGLNRDVRMMDRGVMSMTHGFMMMGMAVSGSHEKIQKLFTGIMVLHASFQMLRGVSFLAGSAASTTGKLFGLLGKGKGGGVGVAGAATETALNVVGGQRLAAGHVTVTGIHVTVLGAGNAAAGAAENAVAGLGGKAKGAAVVGAGGAGLGGGMGFLLGAAIITPLVAIATKLGWLDGVWGAIGQEWSEIRGDSEKLQKAQKAYLLKVKTYQEQFENQRIITRGQGREFELGGARAKIRDQINNFGRFGDAARRNQAALEPVPHILQAEQALGAGRGLDVLLRSGGRQWLENQKDRVREIAKENANRQGEANAQKALAFGEQARAVKRLEDLQAKLKANEAVANPNMGVLAERRTLQQEVDRASTRATEALHKYVHAIEQSNKAVTAGKEAYLENARAQQRHFRDIRLQEEQKKEDFFIKWARMNPMEKQGNLNLLDKLLAGPKPGQGPQVMRGPGGKWMTVPGTVGGLTQEEQRRAEAMFPEQFRQFTLQGMGKADRKQMEDVYRRSGMALKGEAAGKAEQFFANVAAKVANQFHVQIQLNEKALADQLLKIIPHINQAEMNVKNLVQSELSAKAMQRQAAAIAAIGKN